MIIGIGAVVRLVGGVNDGDPAVAVWVLRTEMLESH